MVCLMARGGALAFPGDFSFHVAMVAPLSDNG